MRDKRRTIILMAFMGALGAFANDQMIPEEARRHMVRGQVALKMAASTADYDEAIKEFQEAARLAPEWAAAWYNLGLVQEIVGDFNEALSSLNRFLQMAPDDPKAAKVKTRIYELEYRRDRARKEAGRLQQLLGIWDRYDPETGEKNNAYDFRAKKSEIEVRLWGAFGEIIVPVQFEGNHVSFHYLYKTSVTEVMYEIKATLDSRGFLRGTLSSEVISAQPDFPVQIGHRAMVPTELRKR